MKKKIAGIILIIAGLLLIAWTVYVKIEVERKQKEKINAFQNSFIYSDIDKNVSDDKRKNSQGTIGIMNIPKIDVKVGIDEGVTNEVLNYAVGHFPDTPLPGKKGNSCYAGHRNFTHGEFFNRLDELAVGDEIFIQTRKGTFRYIVSGSTVVEPTQLSVLDQTKEPVITLVTCTPEHTGLQRLIVKAKLESFSKN